MAHDLPAYEFELECMHTVSLAGLVGDNITELEMSAASPPSLYEKELDISSKRRTWSCCMS